MDNWNIENYENMDLVDLTETTFLAAEDAFNKNKTPKGQLCNQEVKKSPKVRQKFLKT